MHFLVRAAVLCTVVAAVVSVSCSVPTDKSTKIYVVVFPSESLLARGVLGDGQTDYLVAKAYEEVSAVRDSGNMDDVELHNVEFDWTSDKPAIVEVVGVGFGTAEVTGQSPGLASVYAGARGFEGSSSDPVTVRVAGLFEVDSVRPLVVPYGAKLTVSGVRMNQLFAASLGTGNLIPDYVFSFSGSPDGLGSLDLWVPPPASSGHLFYVGPGVFDVATDSTTVLPVDLFESDSFAPALIDINSPDTGKIGRVRTAFGRPVLYYNPALFREPVSLGGFSQDWQRFSRNDRSQSVTFVLSSTDTGFAFLSDSLFYCDTCAFQGHYLGPSAWLLSHGRYDCAGIFPSFRPIQEPSVRAIFAFRDLPDSVIHFFTQWFNSAGYELLVLQGYFVADPLIGPDRFEENDIWCKYADRNFNNPATRIELTAGAVTPGFGDSTLTIDNPGEIDWYKFRVNGGPDTVTIRTKARPLGSFDASDIDVYLRRASDFAPIGSAITFGSDEMLKVALSGGDYLLAVVDAANQPTRYALCIVAGTSILGFARGCVPPGAAANAAPAPRNRVAPQTRRVPRATPPGGRLPLLPP